MSLRVADCAAPARMRTVEPRSGSGMLGSSSTSAGLCGAGAPPKWRSTCQRRSRERDGERRERRVVFDTGLLPLPSEQPTRDAPEASETQGVLPPGLCSTPNGSPLNVCIGPLVTVGDPGSESGDPATGPNHLRQFAPRGGGWSVRHFEQMCRHGRFVVLHMTGHLSARHVTASMVSPW